MSWFTRFKFNLPERGKENITPGDQHPPKGNCFATSSFTRDNLAFQHSEGVLNRSKGLSLNLATPRVKTFNEVLSLGLVTQELRQHHLTVEFRLDFYQDCLSGITIPKRQI